MERVRLTLERIAEFTCPEGRQQAFLWDTEAPGLAVRATASGAKAFIFESKLNRRTIRITLGDVRAWVLKSVWAKGKETQRGAREEANRLKTIIDQGKDPRQVAADEMAAEREKREEQVAAILAEDEKARRSQITLGEVWGRYIEARRSKWSARHLFDHQKIMRPERTKGEGDKARTLTAGVLASLAPLPLSALTPERIGEWLEAETPKRGTQAALAFRLLRAFINWCNEQPEYKGIAAPDACARKVSREHLPRAKAKSDALQREQLRLWFDAVRRIQNPTISTYLQGLLLTGPRREELASLRWQDVDFQWNSLTIRDKVEGERTIPLTPYFASLLRMLKAKNETAPTVRRLQTLKERGQEWTPSPWVFSSQTSETGRLQEPSIAHRKALAAVGLPPVSLHGLRRSFGTLSEWCEVPVGVVAQIQGHKPSATAEKHYRVRPLDLLRMWHTRIEAWILEQAGIEFKAERAPQLLPVASSAAA
ncbi:MAG TPA: integrase family protein [Azonexus sp.]|jgi:integrase|nr:integrase family protein [Azonexus sp.]